METIKIYHNPRCGTSRNTLALIRNSGVEPVVIEYLKTPPTRDELKQLISDMGGTVRNVLRQKETIYKELGLDAVTMNWRMVIGPWGMTPEQIAYWDDVMKRLHGYPYDSHGNVTLTNIDIFESTGYALHFSNIDSTSSPLL